MFEAKLACHSRSLPLPQSSKVLVHYNVAKLGTDPRTTGTDPRTTAGDFAVARHRGLRERGIVCMRGNDNKDASRLESYGRFLNGSYLLDGRSCGEHGGEAGAGQGQKATRPKGRYKNNFRTKGAIQTF